MFKGLVCLLSLAMLLSVAVPSQQIQAGAFSLYPIQDGHVCNDSQYGPDQAYDTNDIHIRNQPTVQRCRVGYLMYDISNLKKPGQVFSNVSLSILGYEPSNIIVYGVIESLDHLFVNLQFTTLTWNSVPAGVQNDPTPPVNSPVALDYSDLTEQLIPTFRLPAKGVRESTQPSQALTDFLNSDSDGVIVLLLAPAAEGDNGIIRSIRYTDGGARLEGELGGLPTSAYDPNPDDEVEDVARDVVLSWTPGSYADKHNVYFGTVFDDVNEANEDDLTGILVSKRQDPNTYPVGPLDLGRTYYWRVDEVNAPPDDTIIYKGKTWSFTVEPIAYPLTGANITATASSSSLNMGPKKTIDESGLHNNDQHYTISTNMWLSDLFGPQPTWIKYEFDKKYKLHEMWVWNSNQSSETGVGLGMKSVTIEYSLDDSSWKQLDNVPDFNQATGLDDYTYNTTVNFVDLVAKYVRITANSNWGGLLPQYGLSEVRLFYIPLRARLPQPASGGTGVALDAVLSWRAGRNAALHEVYFSSDIAAVENNIALVDTISQNSYDLSPLGLELGKTYYWKVNEVNEATTPAVWQGEVWSFTAQEYLVVEDFESYDDTCNRIFYAWVDGFGHSGDPECGVAPYSGNITGSTVGHFEPPFAERSIVHGGSQSMYMRYDNDGVVNEGTDYEQSGTLLYSEAERTWEAPQDWTRKNVTSLALWFRGIPASVGSFAPQGQAEGPPITMTAGGADIWDTADQFHFAYKQLSGEEGSITAKVVSISNTDPWAKAGVMIRESLEPGSTHAMMVVTPGQGVSFQRRLTAAASSESDTIAGITAPQWVRLTRSGNTFTGEYSANGSNWTTLGSVDIAMLPDAYIGLCLTSHNVDATCTAEFSNVTTDGTGDWQSQDIGIESNIPEGLYVVLEDSAGSSAVVNNSDPAATTIDTWTEWNMPLTDFAGVNLAAVKKMYIGVGNRASTQPGGAGTLYIDDIGLKLPIQ